MTTIFVILGILVLGYIGITAWIVVRGNSYHALVKQAVIAELGVAALLYLQSRPIVEQITNAFRRGDPAASTALALIMLIRAEEDQENSK